MSAIHAESRAQALPDFEPPLMETHYSAEPKLFFKSNIQQRTGNVSNSKPCMLNQSQNTVEFTSKPPSFKF